MPIKESEHHDKAGWAATVYYAESVIHCGLEAVWQTMIDYQAWNPSFVGAEVTLVGGERGREGEIVLIKKSISDPDGNPWPQFYAATVKLVPYRHIVWYLHLKDEDVARNFVDFQLTEVSSGVKFSINYYAQNRLSGDALETQRKQTRAGLQELAAALKQHCEQRQY